MIGYKIKQMREAMNISREEMADLIRKDKRTYGKIETNEREPSLNELDIISKRFGVKPEDLRNGELTFHITSCNNSNNVSNINTANFENKDMAKVIEAFTATINANKQVMETLITLIAQLHNEKK